MRGGIVARKPSLHTNFTECKAMKASTTQHSADTRRAATEPQQFPPLELVNRPTVPTEQAAHYLLRRPQTLRGWACAETFPDGLRPVRINGRLGWPVAGIRAALGVAA